MMDNAIVSNGTPDSEYSYKASEKQRNQAHCKSLDEFWRLHKESLDNPDAFWTEAASSFFWKSQLPTKNVFNYNFDINKGPIHADWMKGATTNICYNALDKNVQQGHGDVVAYYWEGNDPEDSDKITYRELLRRVCKFANVLKRKGVKKGDMVTMYLPMVLELIIGMFACARIGAIHSVVFGGYSAESLAERVLDGKSRVLVTADGVWRGMKFVCLKEIVDKTLEICKSRKFEVSSVIVVQHQQRLVSTQRQLNNLRNGNPNTINGYNLEVELNSPVDTWWHEELNKSSDICEPVWVDAEHILFTLYTSGSTGKPKGCVHTTGAYMVYGALSFKYVFDYKPGDVFFCTGDIGWLTGHTYIVYGSLLNRATCVLFEGIPIHPDPGRYWSIVEKLSVTHFYTAPTAIRTLMKFEDSYATKYDKSSLRLLGSVGEPLNRDAWFWYHRVIGGGRCPIVDTYWQTETGGILLSPMPFCTPLKPGCAALPFFGVEPAILDEDGIEIIGPGKGNLVIKRPWPAIMRTIYKNHNRYESTYFTRFPGFYVTGDGAMRDKDGFYWVTGRVDDRLNVSGHLLSTMIIEAALLSHNSVAEAAVVAKSHTLKGECLYCFVVLRDGIEFTIELVKEMAQRVEQQIGPFARPEYFHHAVSLPKTRSGKTVRRVLRKIAECDEDIGDLSTLLDETVIEELCKSREDLIRLTGSMMGKIPTN